MDDSDFHDEVDEIFEDIEDAVDELDLDIDMDSGGGVLTLTFEDGSQVILSRQVANHEIWVAAKSGGFHLHKSAGSWICANTNEKLPALVSRVLSEQSGQSVEVL
ncbi:MAG: iron donor protein CyaY [Pseudomonadales bacterium]|nr:iron donor protein CyaY [Pseudomonadales bacterium]